MLGAIIGDTIGSVYEIHNIKTTDFNLFQSWSRPTDDSVMTMAVAEWLLKDQERSAWKQTSFYEVLFLNFFLGPLIYLFRHVRIRIN